VKSGLRVLVAVDFSPSSGAALRAARQLVRRTGGQLTLAHVRPASNIRAAVVEERGDLLELPRHRLGAAVETHYEQQFAKLRRSGGVQEVRLLTGQAARELCREAGRGYDLLAMATRGHGRTAAFLLGSTVQEVLVRSPIPLLVVRASRVP
jgi:nucleotide-binding universal stress UspA family protein